MSLKIEETTLAALPWDTAQQNSVLPIAITERGFRVVIPAETDYDVDTLLQQLTFILNMEVLVERAPKCDVDSAVDFHYGTIDSNIRNCPVDFQFLCPKLWRDLERTNDAAVRYCGACQKNVYLCSDETELSNRSRGGQCVALAEPYEEPLFMGLIVCDDETD